MLPGIPDPPQLAPDETPTAYVPRVRSASSIESVPQSTPPVGFTPEVRAASHARPQPARTVLPWVVFAVLAVLLVGGTTIWSSTLHVPTTPIESLIGPSTTPVATSLPAATPPAPPPPVAPPPAAAPSTAVRTPVTHRAAYVPRAVVRTTTPPAPTTTGVVPPPPPFVVVAPVYPTAAPTTVPPTKTKRAKHD